MHWPKLRPIRAQDSDSEEKTPDCNWARIQQSTNIKSLFVERTISVGHIKSIHSVIKYRFLSRVSFSRCLSFSASPGQPFAFCSLCPRSLLHDHTYSLEARLDERFSGWKFWKILFAAQLCSLNKLTSLWQRAWTAQSSFESRLHYAHQDHVSFINT